jgi:PAS domain S-box-containing protein
MLPSLRHFMSISIVGMTLLLLALLYFHTRLNQDYLQYHLDTHNNSLAIVLRNALMADGLEAELVSGAKQLSAAMHAKISSTLENQLRGVPVLKVKIYSLGAMVLFSSKDSEIGENAKENIGVHSALGGVSLSSLVEPQELNEFDNVIELQDVHQQYIPIASQQTGNIIGAFEIYTDISKILENINSKQEAMFWSMAGILVMFYLALATSFLSIIKLLRNETRQRQAHLAELQAIHSDLERRVEERTAELDHSKQFLQSVIDGIGNPLLVIRPDFTIALMNDAAKNLIPTDKDIEDYKHCYQVSHQRDTPCSEPDHPCSFAQVMDKGRAARARHTHYDANNQPVIVDLLTTPLYSPNGEFEGVIEVEHDVTDMVRMQAGLEESEAHLQAIMDNVPDAILTCNSDCVIQGINPSALRLFDGKESDLIGRNLRNFFTVDADLKALKSEISEQKEVMLKRVDKTEFPADLWIGPLEIADETRSYIAVVRDITSRIQARQEVETTRQQYFHQEKMAAIGQLAAGILHEVGNPIAAIAGAASALKTINEQPVKTNAIDDTVSNNIEVIDEQATRLGKIIREIADFASPKPREREMLDLNGLLRSTTRVLAYDRRFGLIELDLKLDKNLPAILGVADQLTQVFMNLLINAMDACSSVNGEKDRILLISHLDGDGDRVHIYVQDNGHGMSKETLGRVREPFYTTKDVGKGSGLGLSLCETIVLAHGGTLEIETEEGKGTTVHVFLPIDLTDQESGRHEPGDN